jgi:hypothetical protein
LYNYGTFQARAALMGDFPLAGLIVGAFSALPIALFLRGIVLGCVVRTSIAEAEARRAGPGECLGLVMRRLLPLIAASALFAIGTTLGLALMIVPGVLFATMFSVVVPVAVEERLNAFGAFGRASDLTRGARWKILGIWLVVALLVWSLQLAGRAIAIPLFGWPTDTWPGTPLLLWEIALATLGFGFSAAVQTSLYVELRDWKDGPAPERLSEIFA